MIALITTALFGGAMGSSDLEGSSFSTPSTGISGRRLLWDVLLSGDTSSFNGDPTKHIIQALESEQMSDGNTSSCSLNCSGNGECFNGHCHCMIRYEGDTCKRINFSYHVAFASVFFLLALTSLIQLAMCIYAEYLRMKKRPSVVRACRITTQKFLYFLVFLAATLRGAYFAAPTVGSEWSMSLLSAYYPVVLTSASLIVCFWAEIFHLREIRWDRPRFLSKSFFGFLAFNIISYSLLIAELFLVWLPHHSSYPVDLDDIDNKREYYAHIFNGCYAVLMFVVVIFFLIYGVEVFFKANFGAGNCSLSFELSSQVSFEDSSNSISIVTKKTTDSGAINDRLAFEQIVNTSQLHQSRVGMLSQALMMIITVGFLFSETLEEFWKAKVNLTSRNTHDIVFRTIEIGVALWFPCVLWNCIRPEQLWCLNPKKIIERSFKAALTSQKFEFEKGDVVTATATINSAEITTDDESRGPECWICYDPDRSDAGPMIHPCDCRGDVGAVHHECLKRWLIESTDNPDALKCKVCSVAYMVEREAHVSLANGFTSRHWLQTATLVTLMCLTWGGWWAVVQFFSQPWIRILAVGFTLLVQYICLRSLGLNTITAYQRARVSALKIVNMRSRRIAANNSYQQNSHSDKLAVSTTQAVCHHQQVPVAPLGGEPIAISVIKTVQVD